MKTWLCNVFQQLQQKETSFNLLDHPSSLPRKHDDKEDSSKDYKTLFTTKKCLLESSVTSMTKYLHGEKTKKTELFCNAGNIYFINKTNLTNSKNFLKSINRRIYSKKGYPVYCKDFSLSSSAPGALEKHRLSIFQSEVHNISGENSSKTVPVVTIKSNIPPNYSHSISVLPHTENRLHCQYHKMEYGINTTEVVSEIKSLNENYVNASNDSFGDAENNFKHMEKFTKPIKCTNPIIAYILGCDSEPDEVFSEIDADLSENDKPLYSETVCVPSDCLADSTEEKEISNGNHETISMTGQKISAVYNDVKFSIEKPIPRKNAFVSFILNWSDSDDENPSICLKSTKTITDRNDMDDSSELWKKLTQNCDPYALNGGSAFTDCSNSQKDMCNSIDNNLNIKKARKVTFCDKPVVHNMFAWSFAYKMARCGDWERYSRDNERFRCRIYSCEEKLSRILSPDHRSIVYKKYYNSG